MGIFLRVWNELETASIWPNKRYNLKIYSRTICFCFFFIARHIDSILRDTINDYWTGEYWIFFSALKMRRRCLVHNFYFSSRPKIICQKTRSNNCFWMCHSCNLRIILRREAKTKEKKNQIMWVSMTGFKGTSIKSWLANVQRHVGKAENKFVAARML